MSSAATNFTRPGRPTVSIIVPAFRAAEHIARAIDSVIAQTYRDWELIVVNDGGNDGTAAVVERYKDQLGDRLIYLEQGHSGCCVARNTGIEAARGRFLAFLDADDEYRPDKLERQMSLFGLRPDLGLVFCDFSYIDLAGHFVGSVFDTKSRIVRQIPCDTVAPRMLVCPPNLFDYLLRAYFIATIVGVVRRDVLADDVRFLPFNLYNAEWMFYLEIVRRARAGYVDEPLCLHHWVGGSASRTSSTRNVIYQWRLLKAMRERFADASPAARAEIQRQLADTCRQLGMASYKEAEYGPAMHYFVEALARRWDARTAVHLVQSLLRWVLVLGRPGREPLLRFDPTKTSLSM